MKHLLCPTRHICVLPGYGCVPRTDDTAAGAAKGRIRYFQDRTKEVYEIDRLTDHDYKFGVQWYKVAWKGFSEVYESTWEPRTELMKNASKLVLKYEQENKLSLEDPERRKKRRR
jgi:hypothetical protein